VDLGGSEYVILSDEELSSAEPKRSKYIEITDFVSLDQIDPVYFNTTYYLAPEGEAAVKAYALLRQAMQESGKVAIATFVMRNKEYLVAIRPEADVLALETMYFSDEVRSPSSELPNLPRGQEASDQEAEDGKPVDRFHGIGVGAERLPRHAPGEGRGLDRGEAQGKTIAVTKEAPATKGGGPHGGLEREHSRRSQVYVV